MLSFPAVRAWSKIGNALLAGERAASELRLWPCVHNFMNTHSPVTAVEHTVNCVFTHCILTLWSRGNPHHLADTPTPPCLLFSWMLPLLVSVLLYTQVALLPGALFFNMYLVISYLSTKRWTCHRIYTCVCSSLPFPEADSSANYSIPGPLEAHWMNEWDCHKSVPCISGKSVCQIW